MGDYTLQKVIEFTKEKYPNRFDYKNRDVIKSITIKDITQIERHDVPEGPRQYKKYEILSKSYPQYPPYYTGKDSRGRIISYQRSVMHQYDVIIEMDELSLSTKNWTLRVGSGKKWKKDPPQNKIKTLYARTKRRLKRKASRSDNPTAKYRQLVKEHKRRAPYLDVGDYNSQVLGLNGDWIFRCDYPYYKHNHRFGRNYYGNVPARITNPSNIVFLPKHAINTIEQLMQRGIITR